MFATLLTATLLIVPAIQGALAEFTMITPQISQCQDFHVSWDKTQGPYNVIAVPAADPCADPIADLGSHQSTSISWKGVFAAGTQLVLTVEDALGDEAWSGDITVGASKDTSCLPEKIPANTTSTSSTTSASGTTLSIPPTHPTPSSNTPAGAINNAGSNPSSGSLMVSQVSGPMLAAGVFIGALLTL